MTPDLTARPAWEYRHRDWPADRPWETTTSYNVRKRVGETTYRRMSAGELDAAPSKDGQLEYRRRADA